MKNSPCTFPQQLKLSISRQFLKKLIISWCVSDLTIPQSGNKKEVRVEEQNDNKFS